MAIEAGDVVLKFLGDTTNIDRAFDKVDDGVKKFPTVPPEVPESIRLTGKELREARGEARLLGEEIGVRLPRHVSNFLAEIPGVGQALQAAFSATAVLYLANALVDITKKGTDFVANNLIFTQSMKDSNAAAVEANKILLELADKYDKAKDSIEKFGAKGTDSMRLQLQANKDQLATLQQSLVKGEENTQQQRQVTHEYLTQTGWLAKGFDWIKAIASGSRTQIDTIKQQTTAIQNGVLEDAARIKALKEQNELLEKQLETEHKIEAVKQGGESQSSGAKLRAAKAANEVAEDAETAEKRKKIAEQLEDELYAIKRAGMQKQLAILKENDENTKDEQLKLLNQMKVAADNQATVATERMMKQKDEIFKFLSDVSVAGRNISLPPIITVANLTNLQLGRDAAHNLGITLREDLVAAFVAAKKAQDDFMKSGLQDGVAQAALANNILKAKAALDAYGQDEDKFKIKSHGIFAQLENDSKTGAQALQQWKQVGANAFSDIATSAQTAIANLLLAQGSFGKALEKATEQVLASVASQAVVTGIFDLAKSYEAAAHYDYGAAGQYMAAAETMFVVAALAGGAAAGMSRGLGGSSSSTTQTGHSSQGNTSSQAGRSGGSSVGVQGFAMGGLITGPTLALAGEAGREAVIPLDDPRAMKEIGKAVGSGGGSGLHVHFHGPVIGASDVAHLVGQISKRVNRGQAYLQSSNSLRVTKRSA